MTDRHPSWQAITFNGQILAAYKLPGGSWRYLRKDGEKQTFPSAAAAEKAARERALNILFPAMRSTVAPTDAEVADKLGLSDWLRSKREDVKKQQTMHRAGKRQVIVLSGRA
jgi:hypothetical protein